MRERVFCMNVGRLLPVDYVWSDAIVHGIADDVADYCPLKDWGLGLLRGALLLLDGRLGGRLTGAGDLLQAGLRWTQFCCQFSWGLVPDGAATSAH